MRRIALALTGILAVLGMTFAMAAPASAAPASSDAVGVQATIGTVFPQVGLVGTPTDIIVDTNLNMCTPFTTVGNGVALSATSNPVLNTITLFANVVVGVCTTPVSVLTAANPTDTGLGTLLGMFGARAYIVT